jgi:hypothetical protein
MEESTHGLSAMEDGNLAPGPGNLVMDEQLAYSSASILKQSADLNYN